MIRNEIEAAFRKLPRADGAGLTLGDLFSALGYETERQRKAVARFLTFVLETQARVSRWHRDNTRQHHRKALLDAYKTRRNWRKADLESLLELGVNSAAQRRLARLLRQKSPGRGVVRPFRSYEAKALDLLINYGRAVDPTTVPAVRRKLLMGTHWWPHFVESAYRGELEVARGKFPDPGLQAKEQVARAAGISPAMVHRECQRARDEQRRGMIATSPSITAEQLKNLLATGELR